MKRTFTASTDLNCSKGGDSPARASRTTLVDSFPRSTKNQSMNDHMFSMNPRITMNANQSADGGY